jgi:hypothetical protein
MNHVNPDQLLSALRSFDVRIHEHAGWRTRNHGTLKAKSIVVHDSVTGSMNDERAAQFCLAGRSDLKGPLYSALIGHDGVCHLIAHGVTWNAGRGNAARLAQARRGQMPPTGRPTGWRSSPPAPGPTPTCNATPGPGWWPPTAGPRAGRRAAGPGR